MRRTFQIALCSVVVMVTGCKKADKPSEATPDQATKAGDPAKPADPAGKPADPAGKPADPAGKPADPAGKPTDPAGKPADPAGKPADPAGKPADGNTELENKGIAMMRRMADLFVADANNCEKMATDIRAFTAQNKELLRQLAALEKQLTTADKLAFEARNKAVQDELLQKVTPAMTACEQNKSVEAAMRELEPE